LKRDTILSRVLLFAAIGGLLPLGASLWWVLELFAHFRVQYILLALVLAALAISLQKPRVALFLGVTAALNAWPVLPYLPNRSQPPQSGYRFDVLNINVNARNSDYTAIAEAIRAADTDLVAVIELTPGLDRALGAAVDLYPFRFSASADNNFGIGILSRYPLISASGFSTGPTTAIDSVVQLPTGPIRLIATHLFPPMGQAMARIRNRQLDQLASYAAQVEGPLLICGDFNLTPYSPYFARFAAAAQLRDVRQSQGINFSWPSFMPLAGIPIDHCFIRGPLAVESVERLDRFGSDHYPVNVSLIWQEDQ
jgi:endonuclease/exonuclease/phosphatase (EEP) superfamily protein YafD